MHQNMEELKHGAHPGALLLGRSNSINTVTHISSARRIYKILKTPRLRPDTPLSLSQGF